MQLNGATLNASPMNGPSILGAWLDAMALFRVSSRLETRAQAKRPARAKVSCKAKTAAQAFRLIGGTARFSANSVCRIGLVMTHISGGHLVFNGSAKLRFVPNRTAMGRALLKARAGVRVRPRNTRNGRSIFTAKSNVHVIASRVRLGYARISSSSAFQAKATRKAVPKIRIYAKAAMRAKAKNFLSAWASFVDSYAFTAKRPTATRNAKAIYKSTARLFTPLSITINQQDPEWRTLRRKQRERSMIRPFRSRIIRRGSR